jgi:hypothetical protein
MFKKLLIIGLIIFIGLVGAGFLYMNHVWIPKHLKPLVVDMLEKSLEKNVSIDKAFYFPFKGVLFSGIYIENQDKTPYLSVDKVDLSLKSLPKIKTKQAAVKTRLLVKGISFKQQGLEAKGSLSTDLELEVIEGQDPLFKASIKLDDLQVLGIKNLSDITKINGKIICDQNSFETQGLSALIRDQKLELIFKGTLSESDVLVEQGDIIFGKTKVSIIASFEKQEPNNIDAQADGVIDLSDVAKILAMENLPDLKGDCQIKANANGSLSDLDLLKANMNIGIDQGSVDKIRFSQLKADLIFAGSELNLAPVYCNFYEGKISASAKAKIKDIIPMQCSVDVEQVNIEPLIKDLMSQDMGSGLFNAHVGVSGSAVDLNTVTGSGWFKIDQASLKPPPNFKKVAKTLGSAELSDMVISQSSATFSIIDGKARTEDFIAISDYAIIRGKGYIDLEQYVDFAVNFELTDQFLQRSGGLGQVANIAADGATVKLYDKISQLKYKVDFSAQDLIKGIFDNNDSQEQGSSSQEDINEQLKKGLRKLFR